MMRAILDERRDCHKAKKNKKRKNVFFRVTLFRRCKHFSYDIPLITVTNETKF